VLDDAHPRDLGVAVNAYAAIAARGAIALVALTMTACTSAPSAGPGDGGAGETDGAASTSSDASTIATGEASTIATGDDGASAAGPRCKVTSDCAGSANTFCEKDSCDPAAEGTCAIIPGTRETGYCQPSAAFVCGCDGQTYAYACLAHAESVNVASQGPCPIAEGGAPCTADADCGSAALFCRRAHCSDASGVCAGLPDFQVCFAAADAGETVCGCDHVSYDTACEAAASGINVDFDGVCPAPPSGPCTSQGDCGGDGYAAIVYCMPTSCGAAAGTCTPIPGVCPEIYQPVCGCDGMKYANSCFAQVAKLGYSATDAGCPAP
jgi:hypothetical protein